jgi:adenosylcobinamide kinase/adenosylcobinamide-phosphate guanylyltransferase
MLRLVLGGQGSGKSDLAMERFLADPGPHVLLATGSALDQCFRDRILAHRARRAPELPVRETGAELPAALHDCAHMGGVLVDSLDFWVHAAPGRAQELLDVLDLLPKVRVTVVSSEISLGPVAASAQVRAFVRELGLLHQALAARSQEAVLCVAGLPVPLKRG